MLGLVNTVSSGSVPESKYSLSFDGTDDYLDLGLIDFDDNNFSCSLWFKVADGVTWTEYAALFDNRNTAGGDVGYQIRFTGDVGEVMLFSDFGGTTISGVADGMSADAWYHIVATVDRAGDQVLYVNGSEENTADISGQSSVDMTNALNLKIGKAGNTEVQAKISEVVIWNVALDSAAVTAIYNSGRPTNLTFDSGNYDNSSALVAYYKMGNGSFDDKANGVIHDQHAPGFGGNEVYDGDFPSLDNWTILNAAGLESSTVTLVDGAVKITYDHTETGAALGIRQNGILTSGKTYVITMDIVSISGSGVKVYSGSQHAGEIGTGFHKSYFVATGANFHIYRHTDASSSVTTIDNIVIKQLNGNPGLTSGGPTFSSDTP